jgi:hypothetical protein
MTPKLGVHIGVPPMVRSAAGLWVPSDTDGLVAAWDPSVGQGTQVFTDTYGANNGQLGSTAGEDTNDPTWVADPPSLLYGGDDWCEMGGAGDGSYCDITDEITIIVAAKPSTLTGWQGLFSKSYNGSTMIQYQLRQHVATQWQAAYEIGGVAKDILSTAAADVDTWQTVGFSHKTGDQKLFRDGLQTGTAMTDAGVLSSEDSGQLLIGELYPTLLGTFPFNGNIGVCLLYDAHKTEAEFKAIHNDIRANFDYSLPEAV